MGALRVARRLGAVGSSAVRQFGSPSCWGGRRTTVPVPPVAAGGLCGGMDTPPGRFAAVTAHKGCPPRQPPSGRPTTGFVGGYGHATCRFSAAAARKASAETGETPPAGSAATFCGLADSANPIGHSVDLDNQHHRHDDPSVNIHSSFGVSQRESRDSSGLYRRFTPPVVSSDGWIASHPRPGQADRRQRPPDGRSTGRLGSARRDGAALFRWEGVRGVARRA
jgi:hypothetical protein